MTGRHRRVSAPSPKPDFGARAARYDELRPANEAWWELFEVLVREGDLRGRRVLDAGCGTGVLSAALAERAAAKVWAVDAEPRMVEVARARVPDGVGVREGSVEALPFRDGWFERAVLRLVLHLVDRPRALGELRRVLGAGGRLVLATFDPDHFDGFWLNRLFPTLEAIDRVRFPTPENLSAELPAAGFEPPALVRVDQRGTVDRADALERIRGRHISTFDLLPEGEWEDGLARAERELPETFEVRHAWLVVAADVALE